MNTKRHSEKIIPLPVAQDNNKSYRGMPRPRTFTPQNVKTLVARIKRVELKLGIENGEQLGTFMDRVKNLEKKLGITRRT